MLGNSRQSWILGFTLTVLRVPDTVFRSLSVELGFRILLLVFPDSLSRIPDSKAQDSGFPQAKISQISESEFHSTGGDCNPGTQTG